MKKLLIAILLPCIACNSAKVIQPASRKSESKTDERINRIENNLVPSQYLKGHVAFKSITQLMQEDNIPGVSIAFIDSGKISWQRVYGYANLADALPLTTSTIFTGASLSKPLAAMAVLKLADRGLLNIDENINKYLKDWKIPDNEFTTTEKVTVRRLIGHTAGIKNHLWSSYAPGEAVPTLKEMLAGTKPSVDPAVSIFAVPGSQRRYSNPGYSILEKLIEDITGKDFAEALNELVLQPCQMQSSSFIQPIPAPLKQYKATGYTNDLKPYPYKLFPFKAAGGIWTTPDDLGRFLVALLNDYYQQQHTILSKEMADKVFQFTEERLGFTKSFNNKTNELVFEHWGSNAGFTCYMVGSLRQQQGLVIMTNSDNGNNFMSAVAHTVAQEYGWELLQPKVYDAIQLSSAQLNNFSGTFEGFANNKNDKKFIIRNDSLLMASVNTEKYDAMVAVAENKFIIPGNYIVCEFLKNKENIIRYVRITEPNGNNYDLQKK